VGAGVGVGGGKPGSSAKVWRSLYVDEHAGVEPAERGQHDINTEEDYRDGRSGEV
jgi:protein tyrosine/serine phosphatase